MPSFCITSGSTPSALKEHSFDKICRVEAPYTQRKQSFLCIFAELKENLQILSQLSSVLFQ